MVSRLLLQPFLPHDIELAHLLWLLTLRRTSVIRGLNMGLGKSDAELLYKSVEGMIEAGSVDLGAVDFRITVEEIFDDIGVHFISIVPVG